jgi:isopentenyldiphosphate isomerase
MSGAKAPFEYPPSLQEYMVPDREFLQQHPQIHILCSGAVVFNEEGKMLLVQRAKEEHAFPNLWVRRPATHTQRAY